MTSVTQTHESTLPLFEPMTVSEAAAYLGVTHMTVRRAIESGELTHMRIGRAIRVDAASVRARINPAQAS